MSLQEADYGQTEQAFGGINARFANDSVLAVKFYIHPKLSQKKSEEAGRPIYEEIDYISIMQPGNKDSIIMRPATSIDKGRFPEHYKKFKAREDQEAVDGTPLTEWPGISRSQCEELRYMNCRTVEQLVDMSDSNAQSIMAIGALQERARKFLERASKDATSAQLQESEEKVSNLTERLEKLESMLVERELQEEVED